MDRGKTCGVGGPFTRLAVWGALYKTCNEWDSLQDLLWGWPLQDLLWGAAHYRTCYMDNLWFDDLRAE